MKEIRSAMRLPILLAALLFVLPARADTPPNCAGASCADGTVQEESPFLWFGKPLSDPKVHDRVRTKYGQIAERYPSAASCLENNAVPSEIMDARMNWEAIGTREEAEVCLFRLFSRMGSLDRILMWFDISGFDRLFLYVGGGVFDERYIYVSGRYDTKEHGLLYGAGFLNSALQKSVTVSVRWSDALAGVTITEQSIWSK